MKCTSRFRNSEDMDMRSRSSSLALLAFITCLSCKGIRANTEPTLPPGAVVRLGNTNFWHNRISEIAFAVGGKVLASSGSDGLVRLWEVPSGRELRCFDVSTKKPGGTSD